MKEVDAKGAIVVLADDVEAVLKASEISRDRVEDARNVLKEGDEVEAKIINIDRKSRVINLSVKSKDVEDEKDAMEELRKQETEAAGPTTMGTCRQQMETRIILANHCKKRDHICIPFFICTSFKYLFVIFKTWKAQGLNSSRYLTLGEWYEV